MPQTATQKPKKRAPAKPKAKAKSNGSKAKSSGSKAKSNGSAAKKSAAKTVKSAAGAGAAKATLTTRPGGPVRMKMAGAAIKAAAEKAKEKLPAIRDGSRGALDVVRNAGWDRMAEKVRTLPVQCSLDVAVPLEAAWDEWMRFDWMPDGAHRVQDVERDGDVLIGQLSGARVSRDWEAEIVDERQDQSLAWQTVEGSDTSGLITFHRLSDRLTRLELQLDVVPEGMGDALALVLRQADRRAKNVMRGFKAQVEALDPDEYPEVAEEADDEDDEGEEAATEEDEAAA